MSKIWWYARSIGSEIPDLKKRGKWNVFMRRLARRSIRMMPDNAPKATATWFLGYYRDTYPDCKFEVKQCQ